MSWNTKIPAGNIQTSLIIPLKVDWSEDQFHSDWQSLFKFKFHELGWCTPGNNKFKQTKYLIKESSYTLLGMSATFQNVWTPYKNQEFTCQLLHNPRFKRDNTSQLSEEPCKSQLFIANKRMSKKRGIICDLMDVQLVVSPFGYSYCILRLKNTEDIDSQAFIYSLSSKDCVLIPIDEKKKSQFSDYLFDYDVLCSETEDTSNNEKKSLTVREQLEQRFSSGYFKRATDIGTVLSSILPKQFHVVERQGFFKHQTTVATYEDNTTERSYKLMCWTKANKRLNNQNMDAFYKCGVLPFESSNGMSYLPRHDGSIVGMSREGNVYHINTSVITASQKSKVDLHHGRYLLVYLQALMQYDTLQYYNVETTRLLSQGDNEQTLQGIEFLSKRLQYFEHWMPEDIGGSSFTTTFYNALLEMYKIRELRIDLRSTIQMLTNQYTMLVQKQRDEKEAPLLRLVAVLLGVVAFFSLPACTPNLAYIGWQIFVIFFSILTYAFSEHIVHFTSRFERKRRR